MKTKLESFAILADNGFRKVGEIHQDNSGITSEGSNSVYANSPMTAQTISGIGSVGKQHTAATLLKLWDNELSTPQAERKNWFVDGDDVGMDVKLKKFLPLLKEKYPSCAEFFNQIEQYEYFERISLGDLLNHTHGLGARDNAKMRELILASDGSPLPLSDIVKSSKKRTQKDVGISDSTEAWDKYGEMHYGNLGYDLVGMIIETITEKDFDQVVKETLLEPYGLNSTATQSDHRSLYSSQTFHGQKVDVATGFAQEGDHGEINFNLLSNTRAAGGMKSTIADLEKFAHLFMGGEMFENAQVKQAIAQRDGKSYHFAIEQNGDGTFGHAGDDTVFRANLKFDPRTNEVEAQLQVLENLTHHVSRKVFEKLYGAQRLKEIDSAIVDSGFFPIFHQNGQPTPGGEKFNQLVQGLLDANPKLDSLVSDYTKIREVVASHDMEYLKENIGEIVDSISAGLSQKKQSFVEKLGLKKPLVIFVGEQHDNMAYGSLIENLAKQCEVSGLKVQIFSEFESQTQKIEMEEKLGEKLRNVPRAADFNQTTKFLDENFIKMGDLDERIELIARKLEEHLESGVTPRQLFEQTKEKMIVSPGVLEVIESDLNTGEETGETYVGREKKPFNLENFYHNYRAQFNHEEVHGRMLQDFRAAKKDDTDVFIIVAGFGHTYGLDQELVEFADCEKFVVTNFLDHLNPELRKEEREKEARTAPIGKHGLLEFDVDSITKKAEIPEILQSAIAQRSSKESWVKRLGLEEKSNQEEKSFVERMRSDPTGGLSPFGYKEV